MSSVKKWQSQLLDWYDRHQRVLPWRARKGRRPDPYHVWLSEIMLQQTTVVTVGPYFEKFLKKWPSVKDLAQADLDDVLAAWAGLGYYARARNLHKCANVVLKDYRGKFPDTLEALLELPGIGPYTAAAIASIAFDRPATAVDGNVERVITRFFAIEAPLPLSKPDIQQKAAVMTLNVSRPGDFTQAMMELGATVCSPRNPKCMSCPWLKDCAARRAGLQEGLPRKLQKKKKPVRYGRVYWIEDGKGRFLIHKRDGQGLYEGMYQLPTTDWLEDKQVISALPHAFKGVDPLEAEVRHSFTHFDLVLEIWRGKLAKGKKGFVAIGPDDLDKYALPTLMKKAARLCISDIKKV